jgi:hypothetical protein
VIEQHAVLRLHVVAHEVARLEIADTDPRHGLSRGPFATSSIEHSLGSLFISQ